MSAAALERPRKAAVAKRAPAPPAHGPATYMDKSGVIDIGRLASALVITRDQLAVTAGLSPTTLKKADRSRALKPQQRLREMLEILARIEGWAGGQVQALAWYRSQPIPALDGRTAEALVRDGKAASVRSYLDHVALGGFA